MKCRHHLDKEATHIVDLGHVPVCDECAKQEEANGLKVVKVLGWLLGYPMVLVEEPEEWPDIVV